MKLKNFNLSFFVLIGLVFLSFAFFVVAQEKNNSGNNVFLDSDQDGLTDAEEKTYGTDPYKKDTDGDGYSDGAEVKAGYDPLKPAPGDKITTSTNSIYGGKVLGQTETNGNSENITEKLAQKISEVTTQNSQENKEISLEEIQSIANEALDSDFDESNLPEIDDKEIKIKEQNYDNLSENEKKKRKKEDFIDYITSIFYIISSNSPSPLSSATNIGTALLQTTQTITLSIINHDSSRLETLSNSGQKMLEQLKEIEVPEEIVETHKKIMQYAMYSQTLKECVKSTPDDPVKDIVNLSKIQSFISSLSQFSNDIETKFTEYDISYDETIKNKLKSMGINPPDIDESALSNLVNSLDDSENSASASSDSSSD